MDLIDSGSEPADEEETVVTETSFTVAIAPELVNVVAPFASALFDTMYVKITILSSDSAVPIAPSPKYTSYFPASTS